MARPKGSKNKPTDEKELQINIAEDPILFDEELISKPIPKNKILIGYHPITGDEVWQ